MNHLGTINLETKRLFLRKLTTDDANDIFYHWTSDPIIMWVHGVHKSVEKTKEEIGNWIKCYDKKDYYEWGIELKDNKLV